MPCDCVERIPGLKANWTFSPSPHPWWPQVRNSWLIKSEPPPAHKVIRLPVKRERWVAQFLYCPNGRLDSAQLYTLNRLRELSLPLMVICACPSPEMMPSQLGGYADALCWKAMPGYDFSAYTISLWLIARHSPGADVLLLNDSMYGPFSDLDQFFRDARWELSALTASGLWGNHLQSYALLLRDVCETRMDHLKGIFNENRSSSHLGTVVFKQELCLGDHAARHMSVGAMWYGDGAMIDDPCLRRPFELLDAGFPFMKKSLLGKMSSFQRREDCIAKLREFGHPEPC
jgi:hypothetical protein